MIKTPLEPGKTFSDDHLRLLRCIRFSTQLGLQIQPETFDALKKYKSRIRILSKERIATELTKILASDKPSIGFKHLFDTGLLELVFPEMAELHGCLLYTSPSPRD